MSAQQRSLPEPPRWRSKPQSSPLMLPYPPPAPASAPARAHEGFVSRLSQRLSMDALGIHIFVIRSKTSNKAVRAVVKTEKATEGNAQ